MLALLIVLLDKHLVLTNDGIRLPMCLAPFLRWRRSFNWKDVEDIWFVNIVGRAAEDCHIKFVSKDTTICIDLRFIPKNSKTKFLQLLNKYSPCQTRDQQLINLQTQLEEIEEKNRVPLRHYRSAIKTLSPEQLLLSDKQLTIKYSTPKQKIGSTLSLLAFPIWGLLGIVGSFCLLMALVFTKGGADPILPLLFLSPFLFVAGITASAIFFDTALTIGEAGISFPMFMAPLLNFRRDRLWTEVNKIRFKSKENGPLQDGTLVFQVASLSVPINLKYLSRADLEMLLLSLNIWAQKTEQDQEIKILQESFANKKAGLGDTSYTKLWEDELNRRFSSTCFVPLQDGSKLKEGRLCVVKQLAFGGMSAVYLAQMDRTDLLVLKEFVVPNQDLQLQTKARELFEREARILMKLSHPRLSHVHDHFVEQGRTYLLLDYIPGTDLRQIVLQKGPQAEEKVAHWALQVCDVLSYLHSHNPPVVHRDLTPDNILLTAEEQIMLIDFGAANEFVGTATGTLVGKESFISPEQFRGDTVPQSDIYSLGATMFYLLTGEEPDPLSQSFPKNKNSQLSDWINHIVSTCTAFDIADRFESTNSLIEHLKTRSSGLVRQD